MGDSFEAEAYTLPAKVAGKHNAVIYCRVGKKKDAGTSRGSYQYKVCLGFAQCAGLDIVAEYEDAGTYQSCLLPQLNAAIREVEAGHADVLLVEDYDRLNCDPVQDVLVKRRVEAAGGILVAADLYRDGSMAKQNDQLLMTLLGDYRRAVLDGRV